MSTYSYLNLFYGSRSKSYQLGKQNWWVFYFDMKNKHFRLCWTREITLYILTISLKIKKINFAFSKSKSYISCMNHVLPLWSTNQLNHALTVENINSIVSGKSPVISLVADITQAGIQLQFSVTLSTMLLPSCLRLLASLLT